MAALVMALCSLVGAAAAQDQTPRDRLIDLVTIEVVHDLCGFDLTDDQDAALTSAEDGIANAGGVTDADLAALRDELRTSLTRQVPEGLCKPNGAEARDYKRKLAEIGR